MNPQIRLAIIFLAAASAHCSGVRAANSSVGATCHADSSCGAHLLCDIAGKCAGLQTCSNDDACPTHQVCDVAGVCSGDPPCASDSACPSGQFCVVGGVCEGLAPCSSDSACPTGELCNISGKCQGVSSSSTGPCTSDSNCPSGETCDSSGICRGPASDAGPCYASSDCQPGSLCDVTGSCASSPSGPQCSSDSDCETGAVCDVDGTCTNPNSATGGNPAWVDATPSTGSPPFDEDLGPIAFDSARGVTVLFGCCGSNNGTVGSTWEWNGVAWTQAMPANSPPGRQGGAMAFDSVRNETVLFGGLVNNAPSQATTLIGGTWEWDGTNWTEAAPATHPSARQNHQLAFDSRRGVTVLFGGCTALDMQDTGCATVVNDTWEWDGTNWTQSTPAASPAARMQYGLAYDSSLGATVLFGGCVPDVTDFPGAGICVVPDSLLSDTWTWNGTNWTQLQSQPDLPRRYAFGMAYDSDRSLVLLFGGSSDASSSNDFLSNDTWTWDGAGWAQLFPALRPTVRSCTVMAYDSVRDESVVFGGNCGSQLNDTWLLPSSSL